MESLSFLLPPLSTGFAELFSIVPSAVWASLTTDHVVHFQFLSVREWRAGLFYPDQGVELVISPLDTRLFKDGFRLVWVLEYLAVYFSIGFGERDHALQDTHPVIRERLETLHRIHGVVILPIPHLF